jgi:uncharacterized protein YjbJ (UPF0337 family)
MNKDQVRGAIKDAAGKLQEKVGHAFGNRKQQVQGVTKQVVGKTQERAGDMKEVVKDAKNQK